MTGQAWPVDDLRAWAGEWFAARGLTEAGSTMPRAMPWASVVRFELDGPQGRSVVWGKAMAPGLRAEIDVLPVLARAAPGSVLEALQADRSRGLLLLPDGGPTVADLAADAALPVWRDALVALARLQHAAAAHVPGLLAAGAPDLRPAAAADAAAELADRDDLLQVEGEYGFSDGDLQRLRHVVLPRVREAGERFAAEALVPMTVQHDDVTPSNALVDGRWLDWGDASVSHPFGALLTALALLGGADTRPGGVAAVPALRSAYLGVWAEGVGVPVPDLERELDRAVLFAPLGRALSWLPAGPAAAERYPDVVAYWTWRFVQGFDRPA